MSADLDDAKKDVEGIWEDVKNIPDYIKEELSSVTTSWYNLGLYINKASAMIPTFHGVSVPDVVEYYDEEEPTLFQRTIFFHAYSAYFQVRKFFARLKWYYELWKKNAHTELETPIELATTLLDGDEPLVNSNNYVDEWNEGVENLAHAFHALPSWSDLIEGIHDDCYTDEDVANAKEEGLEEGRKEAERDGTPAKLVYEVGGWSLLNSLDDFSQDSFSGLSNLWCYAATNEEDKKNRLARFRVMYYEFRDTVNGLPHEQRRAVTEFLELHFEAIEEYLNNEFDIS